MTDKTPDQSTPGSGAGDAAPTQEIPRMSKPAKKAGSKPPPPRPQDVNGTESSTSSASGTAKKSPARQSRPASKAADSKPADTASTRAKASGETDKGRARQSPPAAKKGTVSAAGGSQGHTLTAADYARTTRTSADSTAVIPAVKDDEPGRKPAVTVGAAPAGSSRRASLRLVRVEPWSVTRLAFAISVAMMIVGVVAVMIFWVVLEATGVWDQINDAVTGVLSDDSSGFDITDYLGFGRLVGLTLVLSAINVILMTALATIGAHLYNLAAQLLGGVEVTFAEEK